MRLKLIALKLNALIRRSKKEPIRLIGLIEIYEIIRT